MNNEVHIKELILGESKTAQLIRNYNWLNTEIGAISYWPQTLLNTVNIILQSPAPFLILWGKDAHMIYNDAYAQFADAKHPASLGQKAANVWAEEKDFIVNVIDQVYQGNTLSFENMPFDLNRKNVSETIYFKMDFSPIIDNGRPKGILVVHHPTTKQTNADKALFENEERLRLATDATLDGLWDWDFKNDKAWWNQRYTEIIGVNIPEQERSHQKINEYIHPEDREKLAEKLKAHTEKGERFEIEYRVVRPSGEVRYILGKGKAVLNEAHEVTRFTGTITDITDKKLIEQKLEGSEFRFRQIANTLPLVVWTADTNGGLTFISNQWEDFYGNPLSKSLGNGWVDYVHAADVDKAGAEWAHSIKTGQNYETEFRVKHKSGNFHWVLVRAVPIKNEKGEIIYWCGSNTDIQDKKRSEDRINENAERFKTLADNIQNLAWMADANGWIFWYNRRWYEYTGTTPSDMEGWGWQSVHDPVQLPLVVERWQNSINTGKPFEMVFPLKSAKGEFRQFLTRVTPIKNNEGVVVRWVGTNTDIDEQKKAVDEFKALADQSPMIVFTIEPNEEASISYFNKTWLKYLGQTLDEALGRAWDGIVHPDDVPEVLQIYTEAFKNQKPFTMHNVRLKRHDGEYRTFVFKGNPRFDKEGNFSGFVGVGFDVHEQKLAEAALKESSAKFKMLLQTLPQITWTNLPNGEVNFFNDNWYAYTGLTIDESKGDKWQAVIHPDDLAKMTKDFEHALKTGEVFVSEHREKRYDGEYRWHLSRANPIKNEQGEITLWVGTATDIHEQKTIAEKLEKLVSQRTQQLERSNEDLQQFAHVASHDLKEPLRKIKIFTSRVQEEFKNAIPAQANEFLDKITGASSRMQAMIDGILTFSSVNSSEQKVEAVDLNAIILNAESDLEILISQKKATIKASTLPKPEGSSVLLYQLFYNLINNALKFSSPKRPPVITISAQQKGQFVEIKVSDNGIGFEAVYDHRIFETFVRLHSKDTYEGTGLGLALCKKIAERHGGKITAEGEVDKGATFIITLPLKQAKAHIEVE
ncbi:MAG: PAS domain-containing protein [Bacteroidetes bacterium]|nr:PAS domain-containing protein [Bacteroidota bacterium]